MFGDLQNLMYGLSSAAVSQSPRTVYSWSASDDSGGHDRHQVIGRSRSRDRSQASSGSDDQERGLVSCPSVLSVWTTDDCWSLLGFNSRNRLIKDECPNSLPVSTSFDSKLYDLFLKKENWWVDKKPSTKGYVRVSDKQSTHHIHRSHSKKLYWD